MIVSNEQIISVLLSSKTNSEAASRLEMTERQLYSRMHNDEFKAMLSDVKRRLLESATIAAQGRLTEAVGIMVGIMQDAKNPPQTRLNAAEAVLRNGMRLTETTDTEARIDELEQAMRRIDDEH